MISERSCRRKENPREMIERERGREKGQSAAANSLKTRSTSGIASVMARRREGQSQIPPLAGRREADTKSAGHMR
jgi:hypothetical protein